ncbi:MAG: DNA gyrase modulator, partial [Dehalococcoidales bacterium]|nr:DNA gyrase modulator [Dehalococcoidales bacterium]
MEEILERAKKVAEEAEVFAVISEETTAHFEANRLKYIQSKQSSSTALRLIMNGKIGYAAITGEADSQGIVDMAADTAQFGISAEFEFPVLATYPDVEVFDPAVEKVPVNKMVELGEELIAIVREHTLDIVCEAGVSRATGSVRVINSRGGQGSYKESAFRLGIEGTLINDTDMLFVSDSESSCHPLSEIRPLAGMVARQLELAKNQATVASRSMPVIFTPHGVASAIVSPLMTAFNGKT